MTNFSKKLNGMDLLNNPASNLSYIMTKCDVVDNNNNNKSNFV